MLLLPLPPLLFFLFWGGGWEKWHPFLVTHKPGGPWDPLAVLAVQDGRFCILQQAMPRAAPFPVPHSRGSQTAHRSTALRGLLLQSSAAEKGAPGEPNHHEEGPDQELLGATWVDTP